MKMPIWKLTDWSFLRLDYSSVFFRYGIRHGMLMRPIFWDIGKYFGRLIMTLKMSWYQAIRKVAVPDEKPNYNFAFSLNCLSGINGQQIIVIETVGCVLSVLQILHSLATTECPIRERLGESTK